MKIFRSITLLYLITLSVTVSGQQAFDSVQFFIDTQRLNVTLSTDMGNLTSGKIKNSYQPATFTCKLPDSSVVSETIRINARGHMRRSICFIPPLKLNFHNTTSPTLYTLNSLKLVCGCRVSVNYEQLLLREYLIYKMYNLLTDKSFRVRLLNVTYEDSKGKKKPFTQYAFFVENIDALAKRNHCKEWSRQINTEASDRDQMTMVAVFEYMIGNTDWSVTNSHNIKLILSKKDSTARPYAIPYDFDYSGIVNADYAVPAPELGIESVRQRLYRGFPRSMAELQAVLDVFNQQKENLYALIKNFEPLNNSEKKDMIYYLDDFYKTISDPKQVEYIFIRNARQQ